MIESLKGLKNTSELIDFRESENRVLADNIISKNNIPEFDNSAVDGFGINYNSINICHTVSNTIKLTNLPSSNVWNKVITLTNQIPPFQ